MSDSQYRTVRVSDIIRDGMVLELWYEDNGVSREIGEIFYSDITNNFTISLYETEIALPLVEDFITEARVKLPSKALSNHDQC